MRLGASVAAALAFSGLDVSLTPVTAAAQDAKLKWTKQTTRDATFTEKTQSFSRSGPGHAARFGPGVY
ncbi:hypothetical protein [uncultured Desulfovibrio sp.]|uniref:hypothetical protein n=1 Tax=uncultured Desulfovibrio sp. TaxID=167968 RepID=UPI002611A98D|nr:hypothetical protein [uncultured Desulfovibrio sp.]